MIVYDESGFSEGDLFSEDETPVVLDGIITIYISPLFDINGLVADKQLVRIKFIGRAEGVDE